MACVSSSHSTLFNVFLAIAFALIAHCLESSASALNSHSLRFESHSTDSTFKIACETEWTSNK